MHKYKHMHVYLNNRICINCKCNYMYRRVYTLRDLKIERKSNKVEEALCLTICTLLPGDSYVGTSWL